MWPIRRWWLLKIIIKPRIGPGCLWERGERLQAPRFSWRLVKKNKGSGRPVLTVSWQIRWVLWIWGLRGQEGRGTFPGTSTALYSGGQTWNSKSTLQSKESFPLIPAYGGLEANGEEHCLQWPERNRLLAHCVLIPTASLISLGEVVQIWTLMEGGHGK